MALAEGDPHTWVVGFCDECWWSRLARPSLHSFSEEGEPLAQPPRAQVGSWQAEGCRG
jgi:hypothetical protein